MDDLRAEHDWSAIPGDAALTEARGRVAQSHLLSDGIALDALIPAARLPQAQAELVREAAEALILDVRAKGEESGALGALLREYRLSSEEGVLLMCLAEALLRVPDGATADRLIGDKLGPGNWATHLGRAPSFLVNASTFGLLLTGRLVALEHPTRADPPGAIGKLIARLGEPLARRAVLTAVRLLARDFVLGRTIEEALSRAKPGLRRGLRYSFDMLGEAARTAEDAARYRAGYAQALKFVGAQNATQGALGISVKLSALHPRFEWRKRERVRAELVPDLVALAEEAAARGLLLTVDAEEAERLELTLDVFEAVAHAPALKGWNGLGLAVQAYQKRAPAVIDWLRALAHETGRVIPLRLVKGAYWDSEIKRAQILGLDAFPVYTRKPATDTAYLACARRVLDAGPLFQPQFATHNAQTIAAIHRMADGRTDIEFQRLHGMGEALYAAAQARYGEGLHLRLYAPVGPYPDLLAYLVRRLLENGANSSFVSRLADPAVTPAELARDPAALIAAATPKAHPAIPAPPDLYGLTRRNAKGIAFDNPAARRALWDAISAARDQRPTAAPLIGGTSREGTARDLFAPADLGDHVGQVIEPSARDIEAALQATSAAAPAWDAQGGAARADLLQRASDLFETKTPELMALLMAEGGKTLTSALAELRESVDALRYYAGEARARFVLPEILPGPSGERNRLSLHGRGVFACISPWNFPLAIFVGQVAGALAAGNAVIAKPAEQTPLTGSRAVRLLHEAGVPGEVLAFLPGGPDTGAALISDQRVSGVAFTGATETARTINKALAQRQGPIIPLIAETGGLNALIADSTALPEQLVDDLVAGAFDSAGQRCSATRILFVQEEIADKVIRMLSGAMAELKLGSPFEIDTDIGPVIDRAAQEALNVHAQKMARQGTLVAESPLDPLLAAQGTFFAPRAFLLDSIAPLEHEVFGPILHIVKYSRDRLDEVLAAINATGYGLTLALHTRLDRMVEQVERRMRVGNLYVNRNQIGAVIGVQPFGGEGLSGTGPKAGGPNYLPRFAVERTVSINIAAAGGDTRLLSLE